MKAKKQIKSSTPNKNDARHFKTILNAIDECLLKPPFDFQRIIICHSNRPELASALALCSGAKRVGPAGWAPSARAPSVLIVENAGNQDEKTLKSIVFIINQTRGVVVLIGDVRSFARWKNRRKELSAQIQRRTHITLEFEI